MKVLSLSGGATKFIGLVGAAKGVIHAGYEPTDIIGVSSGAIASVPIALGMWDEMEQKGLHLSLKDIFSICPFNEDGSLTTKAKLRALFGYTSLGQQRIQDLLREFISVEDFYIYKTGNYPNCYITAIEMENGLIQVWNVKDLDYTTYLNAVAASAAIPIITSPVEIGGRLYYDGGLREHSASAYLLRNYPVKECVSIYSRPENPFECIYEWDKNLESVARRTLDLLQAEISIADATVEILLSQKRGVTLCQIYLPRILRSLYDIDPIHLNTLFNEGFKAGLFYNTK